MKGSTRTRILLSSAALAAALGLAPGAAMGTAAVLSGEALELPLIVGGVGLGIAVGFWIAWVVKLVGPSQRRLRDPWYQAKLAQFAIQSAKRGT